MKKIVLCTFFSKHSGGLESHFSSLKKYLESRILNNVVDSVEEIKMSKKKNKLKIFKFFLKNIMYIYNFEIFKNKILQGLYKDQVHKSLLNDKGIIYHFHDVLSLYALKELKKNNRFILTVHGPLSRESKMMFPKNIGYYKYLKRIEKEAYKLADKIITVDSGQKDILLNDYCIDERKITVIFNGVDSDEFYFSSIEKNYFLVPRRLVKKNGVHIAILAFNEIEKINLKIAGDGVEMENLKKLVEKLGIKNKVEFLGDIDRKNIKKLILEAKGVIIPSIPSSGVIEATSISALEAMSAGKIVIASRIGGLEELIKNGENGILFEAGDYRELAKLINESLKNEKKRLEIGSKARKFILENNCLKIWGDKILKVYYES